MPENRIHILCTRQIEDKWSVEATKNGIQLRCEDFITIQPILSPKLTRDINQILNQKKSVVIFTSKNAVAIAREYYIKEAHPDWRIYSLSGATQQELLKHFSDSMIAGHAKYSHQLAGLIIQQEKTNEYYFFCGDLRREALPHKLKEAGKKLHELIIYTTRLKPLKTEKNYDGIIFFSPSAVNSFFSCNKILPETVCFAIGQTTADTINQYTNHIVQSTQMSTEKMMETVFTYFHQ